MKQSVLLKTRGILRNGILDLLGSWTKPAPGIHILNGHRCAGELEPNTFQKLLFELSKQATFIKAEEAISMILQKKQPQEPLIAFTFDDGFMDVYDHLAPVLEEFHVNSIIFVNPNYVEGDEKYIENFNQNIVMTPGKRPMRWQHLRELSAKGHVIGAHTMDHYMINSDDTETLNYQIKRCKDVIEENIGKPCDCFAFPYGKLSQVNQKSIEIACDSYKHVFSQSDYKHYFSFDGKVINRRHFEPFWPLRHVKYFLSCHKTYP